ncbi:Biotin carboxyl carrier protein of acetyl-CoA carboxylase, chloroplastic [Stylosanthes scabra]|uniref:Biotin carboxyl carrier protein of acetyl-CoA carboxylase n=1 Tax=Stylosanthes scabra TaxID=79078 RepID=A0ABU6Q764_9FABA|nr:Biotin carboxyl carrier protein of acetyl-CoA carboxylase, chloroplastic [Stylosanthes scabra]
MASSFASTASSASSSLPTPTKPKPKINHSRFSHSNLSFRLSPKPHFPFLTKGSPPCQILCPRVKAQLNEVSLDGSSNAVPPTAAKSEAEAPAKSSSGTSSGVLASQESISQFITQVASLVKLVDSRDIVELQLKQHDCEVTIRKREAMPQPQPPAQPAMYYPPPSFAAPPAAPASSPAPAPTPATPTASASLPAAKSTKSSVPALKSPMSGTFYRSPGPGEPPFVKVGDKVKKGQVLCIIEAMKLMNEIEADQAGTIVEIVAEDGKPVSLDAPLFVIEP